MELSGATLGLNKNLVAGIEQLRYLLDVTRRAKLADAQVGGNIGFGAGLG